MLRKKVARFGLDDGDQVNGFHEIFVLSILGGRERPLVGLKLRPRPIPAGRYQVQFQAYFNGAWQPSDVLKLLGEGGKKLQGKIFRLQDPDVIDSSKVLDYSIAIVVPALTPQAAAISLVKAAILSVPGSGKSATDIEGNIDWFYKTRTFASRKVGAPKLKPKVFMKLRLISWTAKRARNG
jgi:hypothetical protein